MHVVPYATFAVGSYGFARGESDALGYRAQMLVGEPVAMTAELPGQSALAEPLAPRGSILVYGARIV